MARRHLVTLALGCMLAIASPVHAQQRTETPAREKVRELLEEGSLLEGKGEIQKAYVAYLAGWGLEHHYALAANLGAVELRLGKFRDAAEHLAFALRSFPQGKYLSERAIVEQRLREASAHVVRVVVEVDKTGADVLLDGKMVGQAPLSDPIYVEPGAHAIEARLGGKIGSRKITAATAGGSEQIRIALDADAQSPAAAPSPPTGEGGPSSSERSMVPVVIGGSVALVGLAAGIGFLVSASAKADDRDAKLDALRATPPCGPGTPYPAQCAEIHDTNQTIARQHDLSTAGFVVFGVSAAATLTYLLWPSHSSAASGAIRIAPTVSSTNAGLLLRSDLF